MLDVTRAAASFDAKDPSGTGELRVRLLRDMDRRWQALRWLASDAIVERNLFGLGRLTADKVTVDPLTSFSEWFDAAASRTVMEGRGGWLAPYLAGATEMAAQRAAITGVEAADRTGGFATLAGLELRGIVQAVAQQAVRAFHDGLVSGRKPAQIAAAVAGVLKSVGMARSRQMADYMVGKAYNGAILDHLRAQGHTQVGVLAEKRRRRRVADAARNVPQKRHGRTGRFMPWTGKPTAYAIRKAERVKRELEALGEVDVLTAEDDLVCDECQDIADSGPYDIDEAQSLIPAHPNCRCIFVPVDVTKDVEDYNPYHAPAGPGGGQFTSGPGGGGFDVIPAGGNYEVWRGSERHATFTTTEGAQGYINRYGEIEARERAALQRQSGESPPLSEAEQARQQIVERSFPMSVIHNLNGDYAVMRAGRNLGSFMTQPGAQLRIEQLLQRESSNPIGTSAEREEHRVQRAVTRIQALGQPVSQIEISGMSSRNVERLNEAAYAAGQRGGEAQPLPPSPPPPRPANPEIAAKEDKFKKAGIDVVGNEDSKKVLFDMWDKTVHAEPEDFKKDFLGGMQGDMVMRRSHGEAGISIEGYLRDESGGKLARYERTMDAAAKVASSDYFKVLDEEKQGHNIGKTLLAANVDTYQKLGIEKVKVHANIDVGGYAWAKYGYVPDAWSWKGLKNLLDIKLNALSSVPDEQRSELKTLLKSDDPKTIWAVSDSKPGKDLLLNTDWYGALNLKDDDTMKRFRAYVGKAKHAKQ